jgi:hypothetical protein
LFTLMKPLADISLTLWVTGLFDEAAYRHDFASATFQQEDYYTLPANIKYVARQSPLFSANAHVSLMLKLMASRHVPALADRILIWNSAVSASQPTCLPASAWKLVISETNMPPATFMRWLRAFRYTGWFQEHLLFSLIMNIW